ncbi:flagellar hook-length control protein FliK [Endozoicomonas numazuensis]|uniref:Flagellar hook-length control protein-like C-terminal domain-containing protein n=1 Tax=Endozoicomonas numazuensis TaxID=1137799 RepID=A0A081ND19_9GAMM|nr:flagellar hook-length control protein FliK [Endozoicomonas numazuensis]KEQ16342.1 hypothetical protein GZ78_20895 [Endozoicomonas numazuensis]
MDSLPALDLASILPIPAGENQAIHPNTQVLASAPFQQSNVSAHSSKSENSFDALLNLLSTQQAHVIEGSAQLRTLPEPLPSSLKPSHHLPPELAELAISSDPVVDYNQGLPNLQALAQNIPAQPADTADYSLQKLMPQSMGTALLPGSLSDQTGLKSEAGKVSEHQPLMRHEEVRPLKDALTLDGKSFPKSEPYPENREFKPELSVRDFKVLETTPRLEASIKAEPQSTVSNTQNTTTTPLNLTVQAPVQSVEPKIFNAPVSPQTEAQPSMTMRLKEFQDFPNAMGNRLAWLANNEQKTAIIRLDPPELGKLELLLNIDGDKVTVNFQASGNAVRELILQQIDRLRMAMADHDLDLVNVDVSAERESDREKDEFHSSPASSVSNPMVDESTDESGSLISGSYTAVSTGFLDTFA